MISQFVVPSNFVRNPFRLVQTRDRTRICTAAPAIAVHRLGMTLTSGGEAYPVLSNIDLVVQPGTIQLLMGPSGSGKTTLLSILAGLLTPTQGVVSLLGQDLTHLSKHQLSQFRLDNIGFIFQHFNLFPALTAVENVELALNVKGIRGTVAQQEARRLLEQVELGDKANHLPRNLSGGQKQRVAIARALAGAPKLIMADEPTAALDSHNGFVIIELLRHLAKENGHTVFIVTHDARIMEVADRVAYLEDGELRSNQPVSAVTENRGRSHSPSALAPQRCQG